MLDSIKRTLSRIKADILALRNIEAYVVSALAIVLAVLGVVDVGVSMEVKLAVLLAAVALLVFNLTVPKHQEADLDTVFKDMSAYHEATFLERIKGRRTVWVYAISGINLLSPENLKTLRREILNRENSELRVIIQSPGEKTVVDYLSKHLDVVSQEGQPAHPTLADSLDQMKSRLEDFKNLEGSMADGVDFKGSFDYRYLSYCPGFCLVILDGDKPDGLITPEIYGLQVDGELQRMHFHITRKHSARWYDYWIKQWKVMWEEAGKPEETHESQS
jgi:hypothetical protein